MIEILKAQKSDIDSIKRIYERIHDEEEKGLTTIGWVRNIYPTKKTAEEALERGDIFVMSDSGKIVASAIVNQVQVDEYKDAKWTNDTAAQNVMVLHCLVVDPLEKGSELRMDTNAVNTRARRLYRSLGYKEIGIVPCLFNGIPDVQLVCLEKHL